MVWSMLKPCFGAANLISGLGFPKGFPESAPLSPNSLQMIQRWIDICTDPNSEQHVSCPKGREAAGPRRLIDVREGDTIKLVEPGGSDMQYAILSYCWGPPDVMKLARTLRSNISERLVGFSVLTLPQTLRDSIVVIRRLGIPYVWIDAICIVQDSGEWTTEAERMMTYYENAYLTIIPISSTSADEGFLRTRPRWVSRLTTGAWVGEPSKQLFFYFPEWNSVESETDASAWISRGWTFQEGLLSARTLYFGNNGMRFECRGGGWQDISSSNDVGTKATSFLPHSNVHTARSAEWDNRERIRSLWYQLVSQYVERKFTFETDRLLAISGVAQNIGRLLNAEDEYVLGFWKNDLCHGLSWRAWRGLLSSRKLTWPLTKSSSFPSWSWCSMKKPVTWIDGTGTIACTELVEMMNVSEGKGSAQGAQGIKLVLNAWIFKASLLRTKLPIGIDIQIQLDQDTDPVEDFPEADNLQAIVLSIYLDGGDSDQWKASPTSTPHEIYGLVLESISSCHQGIEEYRRLGAFDVVIDMEVDSTADYSNTNIPSFYKQAYASKSRLTLV